MAKRGLTTTLYLIGVILALVIGVGAAMGSNWVNSPWLVFILVVIGLIVGLYNIKAKELGAFLVGTVALIIANTAANLIALNTLIPGLGTFINAVVSTFIVVVAAAAVVVSFKVVYQLAK
ncbi:MAG: hypothetical protein AABY07_10010 [Nanoarchaeota archaeon]